MYDFKFYEVGVGGVVLECIDVGGDGGNWGFLKFYRSSCVFKRESKGGVLFVEGEVGGGCFVCVRVLVEYVDVKG